ncbi:MAG: efflux RND transporter periplasmic adaptor subunit [Hyphomicrobiales bacterium]
MRFASIRLNLSNALLIAFLSLLQIIYFGNSAIAQEDDSVSTTSLSDLPLRVLVFAKQQATLSSRLNATIAKIGPNDGESFAKGDTLIEFDCASYDAELTRSQALNEAAQDTLNVKDRLANLGSVSKLDVILAQADTKRTGADVIVMQEQVRQCKIFAPFDGRVVRRHANAFETVAPGTSLIQILSDRDIEVRVSVPSTWVINLKPGAKFQFRLDEIARPFEAEIVAMGARIENISQSIELRGRITGDTSDVLVGMSGDAVFDGLK